MHNRGAPFRRGPRDASEFNDRGSAGGFRDGGRGQRFFNQEGDEENGSGGRGFGRGGDHRPFDGGRRGGGFGRGGRRGNGEEGGSFHDGPRKRFRGQEGGEEGSSRFWNKG